MKVVNVVFLCKTMTKKLQKKYFIIVDEKAVYDNKLGWICDCLHWTTGQDDYHIAISKGERLIYDGGLIE